MQKATELTQSQLTWLLQTDYGQQLLHQVENYLSMSEETLDKYLPPVQDEQTEGKIFKNLTLFCSRLSLILFLYFASY